MTLPELALLEVTLTGPTCVDPRRTSTCGCGTATRKRYSAAHRQLRTFGRRQCAFGGHSSPRRASSTPAELRRDVAHERIEDVRAVVDTELVGDRQQQGVRGGDRLVLGELLDQLLRFPGVRLAEACLAAVEEADLVL